MLRMMEERKKRIADGLAAAERGQHEKELAEKHAKQVLGEAKAKAAEIIAQAQKRAGEIVEEAKEGARQEGARLKHAAQAEIEQEMNQAREGLRKEVVALALSGAEQVLMREINAAEHGQVLEKLAAEL
jgi:F-type H+-transporting ATPase subunit b